MMRKKTIGTPGGILLSICILLGLLIGMNYIKPHDATAENAEGSGAESLPGLAQEDRNAYSTAPVPEDEHREELAAVPKDHDGAARPTENDKRSRGRVFIVLDDAGAKVEQLQPFLDLGIPLTVAVLPHLAESKAVAELAFLQKHTVFLHLPLEPISDQDPGLGAIYSGNSTETITRLIAENLASVPHVLGVNNHMGSRVTADSTTLLRILQSIKKHELQLLDSRTTAHSKMVPIAQEMNIAVSARDVFLDHDRSRSAMEAAFHRGLEQAEHQGKSIMIGHVTVPALAVVLHDALPQAIEDGFQFLPMEYYHTE